MAQGGPQDGPGGAQASKNATVIIIFAHLCAYRWQQWKLCSRVHGNTILGLWDTGISHIFRVCCLDLLQGPFFTHTMGYGGLQGHSETTPKGPVPYERIGEVRRPLHPGLHLYRDIYIYIYIYTYHTNIYVYIYIYIYMRCPPTKLQHSVGIYVTLKAYCIQWGTISYTHAYA